MGLNSMLKIFLPKDRVFFQLFESVSGVLVKMGDKLKDVVNEPDFDKRAQLIQEVEDMEHVNDDFTHKIFTELGKNFITPFGSFLRKTHIDELPQFWNLVRGEVSLIGPRPEQPHYVEKLQTLEPIYSFRHSVRPGLTGWAQISYPYGNNEKDAIEKLEYDLYYLRHQGPLLDLRIAISTLSHLVFRRGS